jgi:hypothetical protein
MPGKDKMSDKDKKSDPDKMSGSDTMFGVVGDVSSAQTSNRSATSNTRGNNVLPTVGALDNKRTRPETPPYDPLVLASKDDKVDLVLQQRDAILLLTWLSFNSNEREFTRGPDGTDAACYLKDQLSRIICDNHWDMPNETETRVLVLDIVVTGVLYAWRALKLELEARVNNAIGASVNFCREASIEEYAVAIEKNILHMGCKLSNRQMVWTSEQNVQLHKAVVSFVRHWDDNGDLLHALCFTIMRVTQKQRPLSQEEARIQELVVQAGQRYAVHQPGPASQIASCGRMLQVIHANLTEAGVSVPTLTDWNGAAHSLLSDYNNLALIYAVLASLYSGPEFVPDEAFAFCCKNKSAFDTLYRFVQTNTASHDDLYNKALTRAHFGTLPGMSIGQAGGA